MRPGDPSERLWRGGVSLLESVAECGRVREPKDGVYLLDTHEGLGKKVGSSLEELFLRECSYRHSLLDPEDVLEPRRTQVRRVGQVSEACPWVLPN